MIFVLLVGLIIMLFVAFTLTGKDILSPWVISICMFIISVLVAALNYDHWNKDINSITVLVIIIALLSFGFGEIFAKSVLIIKKGLGNNNNNQVKLLNENKRIFIKNRWIFFISCFIVIVLYFHFEFKLKIAMEAGYHSGLDSMFYYARHAQFNSEIDSNQSVLLSLGITFSRIFSYFFIFVFLYNSIFFKFSVSYIKYFIPIILNIGNMLVTTGRTEFINLITVFLVIFFIMLKQKNGWKGRVNFKIILYGIIGIALFLMIFRLSGYLTGKSEKYTLWDNLSAYIGSSIIALDIYLLNPPVKDFFGKETFSSIYHILRKFGYDIPYYRVPNEFLSWQNVTNVNIYTSLRRYIQDFSIFGMLFLQFLLGVFYGGYYQFIKVKNKVGPALIVYAMLFFPVVQFALEERFFMNVISVAGIYNLIAILIVWHFFIRKNK